MSVATPSAMPISEITEMTEIKLSRRLARKYRAAIIHSNDAKARVAVEGDGAVALVDAPRLPKFVRVSDIQAAVCSLRPSA
jgi:hypothetical protein